jgi:hypothetical protein
MNVDGSSQQSTFTFDELSSIELMQEFKEAGKPRHPQLWY